MSCWKRLSGPNDTEGRLASCWVPIVISINDVGEIPKFVEKLSQFQGMGRINKIPLPRPQSPLDVSTKLELAGRSFKYLPFVPR